MELLYFHNEQNFQQMMEVSLSLVVDNQQANFIGVVTATSFSIVLGNIRW